MEFFNESKLREYIFSKYQSEREEVVELILSSELEVDDNGIIELPMELRNEEMVRNGRVCLINSSSGVGIYFCTFTGLLETSSGFIYFTDSLESKPVSGDEIVVFVEYANDWYFCSTD